MLLVDIGNTHAHIFDGKQITHIKVEEFEQNYFNKKLFFINVNPKLKVSPLWIDLGSYAYLEGAYETMGIDRKVLVLSKKNALIVDAGSAITIDLVKNGKWQGGTIMPGIYKCKKALEEISPKLKLDTFENINLDLLPKDSTAKALSFGIIAPIVEIIKKFSKDFPLFFTGGDGAYLTQFFNDAVYDEGLIFKGMKRLKERFDANNCSA